MKARDAEREALRQRKQSQRQEALSLCVRRALCSGEIKYLSDEAIASRVGVCGKTVMRWRQTPEFKAAESAASAERSRNYWAKMRYRLPLASVLLPGEDTPDAALKCPFCGSPSRAGA